MRIGIDASFLRPDALYTGMGTYTRGLAGALAARPAEHEVVLLGYGPRPAAAPAGLPWHEMPLLRTGRLGAWLSHQLVLPRVGGQLGLDVLHVTGVNLRLSQPGVPFQSPCPLVVTVHDVIPLTYYGRSGPPLPWRLRLGYRLAVLAVRRASALITVSETSRRDILACLPVKPERVRVVYNGLDVPPAPNQQQAGAILDRLGVVRPYLLYAGSYEPRKNLLGAVEAYRLALARRELPPLALLVERESGYRDSVLRVVARSGVADRLHFVHSLSDRELAALYRCASLFIYPSYYEGFGFAPLQALAYGIPAIVSSAGSLPEVLGDAAHFVEPASPGALAEAMIELLEHPRVAAALAARGPARAARFRWERAARETLDVCEQAGRWRPGALVSA